MGREITGSSITGNFPPTVRLDEKGASIKGTVTDKRILPADQYGHTNTVVSLALIDLDEKASTQISVSKGVYQEVEVNVGDIVDFVGRGTDLREKVPQLEIGDVVTITNNGESPKKVGRKSRKLFKVTVD